MNTTPRIYTLEFTPEQLKHLRGLALDYLWDRTWVQETEQDATILDFFFQTFIDEIYNKNT